MTSPYEQILNGIRAKIGSMILGDQSASSGSVETASEDPSSEEDNFPNMAIITIVLDGDLNGPKVDLGQVPPDIAHGIFRSIAETMDFMRPDPTIIYDDEVIYTDEFQCWDDPE